MAEPKIIALSGGVGGAKLALGLSHILKPTQLTIVANTGDDFEHLGLPISPDLDTVMYTLAGLNNQAQGWGLANESWQAMSMLKIYGGENWFQLGDRDIATHLMRQQLLEQGKTLSDVTRSLCASLGVYHPLLPMTDNRVRTLVQTDRGELAFQHYFVREQCAPRVTGFRFEGIEQAQAQPEFLKLLQDPQLTAVVICPSNPFVSVRPILSLPGVSQALSNCTAPVIAVSPIVAGAAIKGPTAKMMQELQLPSSACTVAEYYGNLIDGYVIDEADVNQADAIRALGLNVLAAPTVMQNLDDKIQLAKIILAFAASMGTDAIG